MDRENCLGYIKFDGPLVEDGMMDAREQAEALLGVDAGIRHFIRKQAPEIGRLEFAIPIRVRTGSWEALIPETIAGWGAAGLGVVATAYFTKAAQKMAEHDFDSVGFTDLFKRALLAMQWFIKIGKHVGDLSIKSFTNVKYVDNNEIVGISNGDGEYLYVPKYILDLYASASPRILKRLAELVEEDRSLIIGVATKDGFEEAILESPDKYIFSGTVEQTDGLDDTVMPELEHGEFVVLEGEVTRENKMSNSMGFKYDDHIITCYPDAGSIVPYKPLLFLKCRMYGFVNRHDEHGRISPKKPKISFTKLEAIDQDIQNDLFS